MFPALDEGTDEDDMAAEDASTKKWVVLHPFASATVDFMSVEKFTAVIVYCV